MLLNQAVWVLLTNTRESEGVSSVPCPHSSQGYVSPTSVSRKDFRELENLTHKHQHPLLLPPAGEESAENAVSGAWFGFQLCLLPAVWPRNDLSESQSSLWFGDKMLTQRLAHSKG